MLNSHDVQRPWTPSAAALPGSSTTVAACARDAPADRAACTGRRYGRLHAASDHSLAMDPVLCSATPSMPVERAEADIAATKIRANTNPSTPRSRSSTPRTGWYSHAAGATGRAANSTSGSAAKAASVVLKRRDRHRLHGPAREVVRGRRSRAETRPRTTGTAAAAPPTAAAGRERRPKGDRRRRGRQTASSPAAHRTACVPARPIGGWRLRHPMSQLAAPPPVWPQLPCSLCSARPAASMSA